MARDPKVIAARQGAARQLLEDGSQLGMWGEDGEARPAASRGPGRPAGSANKLKTKLREYMAGQGYRDPAVQLALLAGLDRPDLHPLAAPPPMPVQNVQQNQAVSDTPSSDHSDGADE